MMSSSEGLIPIESVMATWVAKLSMAKIPQCVLSTASTCISDGLGVMLAGTQTSVFRQCMELPRPTGYCTLADGSDGTDAAHAAMLNGVACHALDFDDTCYAGIVHGTAAVLPAVMAASQQANTSGKALLEGFVAGSECTYAMGLALSNSFYDRGFWSTATLGVIGAAAGAAKVMGLDAEAIAHAIRIAANAPIGLRATHGTTAKPYLCGLAAKLGVEAAMAAQVGIQGKAGIFESMRGFASTHHDGRLDRAPIDELGLRFSMIEPGVAFKLRPLCSATAAAIEATAALCAEHGINANDVAAVRCTAPALVVTSLPFLHPTRLSEAQFSMSFAIACTLLHGDVRLDHLTEATLADERLQALMGKVDLVLDIEAFPDEGLAPEPSRVEIRLNDGRKFDKTVIAATGMPQRPATEQQMQSKFMDCAMRVINAQEAAELWNRAHRLEALDRVRQLFHGLFSAGRA